MLVRGVKQSHKKKNQLRRGFKYRLQRAKVTTNTERFEYGRDKDAANFIETHREGHSSPARLTKHRRQLQPRRQGHAQARRRRPPR